MKKKKGMRGDLWDGDGEVVKEFRLWMELNTGELAAGGSNRRSREIFAVSH
jgi:hypothetical protein